MDPENEEERKEEQENNNIISFLKKGTKKAKSVFKMIFRKVLAVLGAKLLLILLIVFAVLSIILAFASFMDKLTDNLEAGSASTSILQDENVVSIACTSDGDYYFKISQDVVDKYLEGIDAASLEDLFGEVHGVESDEEDADDEEIEIDEEDKTTREDIQDWFTVEDFDEYLVKMLRAEIASSYPKLSDYTGDKEVDDQGNKVDSDGDYVAQGIVEIHRQNMNKDGTVGNEYDLNYLPYDDFMELVDNDDSKALDYFTFVDGLLYYATYFEEIVTVNGSETAHTYSISCSSPISYKSLTDMCSMPYNFLFALLQTSENPNYVMAVVDLLLEESDVVLMIQDQLSTTIYTEVKSQVEKTTEQDVSISSDTSGSAIANTTTTYGDETTTGYVFPAGYTEKTVTKSYRNTANVYIKKAYTWCIDFEQEATLNSLVIPGEEVKYTYNNEKFAGLSYSLSSSSAINDTGDSYTTLRKYLSNTSLLYSTKTDIENYTWDISIATEKRINYEKFLGLWRNDTGEYYLGCLFDENGEEVQYLIASENGTKESAVNNIVDNDETIGTLLQMLSLHDDTEVHEQLMMYYWNVYMGRDIYDVDLDELLDLFSTTVFSAFSGSGGTISLRECNLTREEFIEAVENYRSDTSYQTNFAQYAGLIYDICVANNINPILCAAMAGHESSFGAYVGGTYNLWGIAVYNNTTSGSSFSSMEAALTEYCNLLNQYCTPGNSLYDIAVKNTTDYSTYNSVKFNPDNQNVYYCISAWAYLGDTHDSAVGDGLNVKQWIDKYLNVECNHSLSDATTIEECAAYIEFYVDDCVVVIAKDMFGSAAVIASGEGTTSVGGTELKTYTSSATGRTYIWYLQNVGYWASYSYMGSTIASIGCYQTTLATIASGYGSSRVPDGNWYDAALGTKGRVSEGNVRSLSQSEITEIQNWLYSGQEVIIHVKSASAYTSSEHWMPIVDISADGNSVYIMNTYSGCSDSQNGWVSLSSLSVGVCCYSLVTGSGVG